MSSRIGIGGAGNVGFAFTVGPSDASSTLDGPDFVFGPYPRFGSLKFDEARPDNDGTANFYYSPITFDTCQVGEYHGYLATTAMF